MQLTATGIAKFHFWGEYSQTFALSFADAEEAALALPVLNRIKLTIGGTDACGRKLNPGQWMQGQKYPKSVLIFASGDDVKRIEGQLVELGADPKKISSCATSIDHGEPFKISINVDDPAQMVFSI